MNNNLNIIITMAGIGKRFRDAGYNCPKYMIEAKGKSLFEWSMDSLINYNPYVKQYIFIVRKEDNASEFIKNKCKKYNIKKINIIELDNETDGQATTCLIATEYCNSSDSILVYNIDTYVEPNNMKYSDIKGDGHIPCFKAQGNHWSFVKLDDKGKVTEVKEKMRISDNCTLGAYYFSSVKLYQNLYKDYYSDSKNKVNNEKYIAPLYNYMISLGYMVTISLIDNSKVHVLGTPEELNVFLAS